MNAYSLLLMQVLSIPEHLRRSLVTDLLAKVPGIQAVLDLAVVCEQQPV